jgi:very-short-patch-repair endonuclease/DNA polymerase III delta prime subunit
MIASILTRLESARKELLDLGLRNPLLNYRLPVGKGLHIVEEQSAAIYDILVRENKTMSFLGRSEKKQAGESVDYNEPVSKEAIYDTRLQTNETPNILHTKLLNTYYAARMSIEEQGVNILYLSLGMLHWYEDEKEQEARLAPLIMIPVRLDRSDARERFRLKYSLEEIGANISLLSKMKADFNIDIPDLPDTEDFEVNDYLASVAAAVESMPRWKVAPDAIELGFFSFGKFMIYNDLDASKWQSSNDVLTHPVIQSLFGSGFSDDQPQIPEDVFIDRDTPAHELFQVVDADSSQIMAMLSVQEGRNLVIQGPPGTGKSQTITNIIADAIGRGKKVLFVAEKLAALEVVKRRLDNIQLGEACLELHSHKANKKELHQELRRVLELGRPRIQKLQEEVVLLDSYKKELNDYCLSINDTIGKSGLTAHQLIGYLLRLNEETAGIALPAVQLPDIAQWDAAAMNKATTMALRIQACLQETGMPAALTFRGSQLTVLLPHEQQALGDQLQKTAASLEALLQQTNAVAGKMGITAPANIPTTKTLIDICELLARQPDLQELDVNNKAWLQQQQELRDWLTAGEAATAIQLQYQEVLIPEAWDQDVLEIRQDLLAHGDKWYKFLIGAYKRSNRRLAALCRHRLPDYNEEKLQYVDAIMEYKREDALLKEHAELARILFGSRWQKAQTNWAALQTATAYLTELHTRIASGSCPPEVAVYLQNNRDAATARADAERMLRLVQEHQQSRSLLLDDLELGAGIYPGEFYAEQAQLQTWINKLPEIHHLIAWNNVTETAIQENLQCLITPAQEWEGARQWLKTALQKNWYEYLVETAIKSQPALRKFERGGHEEIVQQFRKLDVVNLQYNRARAALQHWEQMPRLEAGGQVNILRTEFNKKARHMPIRKLMQEAGVVIQAVKPVFMMSPLSIANFLPPGAVEFDLVIFDEASQVKPVDALGAILRGKQLVVVGDNKQLPPTSFFDSLTRETDDEDNVTADMQSILGLCDAQGAPQRMLRWHYRSRHESLITLSNHEFYENKLVIFPSPGDKDSRGLVFHHLKDTAYDRGKTRTNPKEAAIVADAVMEHARLHPGLSLGVVAFSTTQRQAISDELELRRRNAPELESFFSAHQNEPFFVKNLENVQGDERDVIFISIGYGRTEEGYVAMSFGPLNNDGGERRLNVLITRAKMRCEVFTNITADDIDVTRTKSYGIQSLKNFLYFAQHGKLYMTGETGLPADSPFEEMVAAKLEALGYTVRKQVGSKGFYIDMAIVDPRYPGRYLLGIECDGAAYHSARSARDRDRLRQQVLEGIGWKMYRVWSTDWFRNPEKELNRLVDVIEQARTAAAIDDDQMAAQRVAEPSITREVVEEENVEVPAYEEAVLPEDIREQEFHQAPMVKLCGWVEQVVNVESPVHFDELARRMVEAAGITRVGPRIREILRHAVRHSDASKRIKIKGQFLWDTDLPTPVVRNRSQLPASARKIGYIAVEEIGVALERVVKDAVAIEREEAVPFIARMFGYSRVTEEMKDELLKAIDICVETTGMQKEGELLKA